MVLDEFVEQRRDHLGALIDAGNGFLEFATRCRREEVETSAFGRRLDGFQAGGAGFIGMPLRAEQRHHGGSGLVSLVARMRRSALIASLAATRRQFTSANKSNDHGSGWNSMSSPKALLTSASRCIARLLAARSW